MQLLNIHLPKAQIFSFRRVNNLAPEGSNIKHQEYLDQLAFRLANHDHPIEPHKHIEYAQI